MTPYPAVSKEWGFFGLVFALLYGLLLFHVGQKKDRAHWFFIMIYAPVVASLAYGLLFTTLFTTTLGWIILVLFVLERVAWGMALREAAGEDKLVWFFLIWLVPLFGWFLYRVTSIR